ncbi:transmembrane protein, putative (macronuclear) [Tetrahymena thermophila SB210]|uniref:Transmembrane protein, putative n=1 Tax=Tetrahymena thermophila (strain SB210) TaxID=312017 RepID=Q228R5_TETTS|nr:transmembrane protein, putative [Tetrahymena thermophila SB210]EAR81784.2 transmembrane protein, putative [Tetrahymena thermophila SB210]|eukprot:XP_001029447.2 transmembrane protein, putative [Tetrahymena thermophila SB210]
MIFDEKINAELTFIFKIGCNQYFRMIFDEKINAELTFIFKIVDSNIFEKQQCRILVNKIKVYKKVKYLISFTIFFFFQNELIQIIYHCVLIQARSFQPIQQNLDLNSNFCSKILQQLDQHPILLSQILFLDTCNQYLRMIFDEKINAEITFIFKIGTRNQYFRMIYIEKINAKSTFIFNIIGSNLYFRMILDDKTNDELIFQYKLESNQYFRMIFGEKINTEITFIFKIFGCNQQFRMIFDEEINVELTFIFKIVGNQHFRIVFDDRINAELTFIFKIVCNKNFQKIFDEKIKAELIFIYKIGLGNQYFRIIFDDEINAELIFVLKIAWCNQYLRIIFDKKITAELTFLSSKSSMVVIINPIKPIYEYLLLAYLQRKQNSLYIKCLKTLIFLILQIINIHSKYICDPNSSYKLNIAVLVSKILQIRYIIYLRDNAILGQLFIQQICLQFICSYLWGSNVSVVLGGCTVLPLQQDVFFKKIIIYF